MPEEWWKALKDLKVGEDRTLFNFWEGKHVKHLIRESSLDWTGDSVAPRRGHERFHRGVRPMNHFLRGHGTMAREGIGTQGTPSVAA